MKNTLYAICFLLSLSYSWAASSPEDKLRNAQSLEKRGAINKAIKVYKSFLKDHPEHIKVITATYRMAHSYDKIGDPDVAIKHFKTVIKISKGKRHFKHRADTFMTLAKMQASAKNHKDAAATLEELIGEGAGLYKAEAHDLCAGYLAILGSKALKAAMIAMRTGKAKEKAGKTKEAKKYFAIAASKNKEAKAYFTRAASMFDVLTRMKSKQYSQTAAYKKAIVWIQAKDINAARHAVTTFYQQYPNNLKVPELFMRIAKFYYADKKYKLAMAVCEQVKKSFKTKREAIEAAYVIAICHREMGNKQTAANLLEDIGKSKFPKGSIIGPRVLLAAADLYKELGKKEIAMDVYMKAVGLCRGQNTSDHRKIAEFCLFELAEHDFHRKKWAGALDYYMQLKQMGSKLQIFQRVKTCKEKLGQDPNMEQFIGPNIKKIWEDTLKKFPGTIMAADAEIGLLDLKAAATFAGYTAWSSREKLVKEYRAILETKYKPAVIKQHNLRSYILMQIGRLHCKTGIRGPTADDKKRILKGLAIFEKALKIEPKTPQKVLILTYIALNGVKVGKDDRSSEAYFELYRITKSDAAKIRAENKKLHSTKKKITPDKWITSGIVPLAKTPKQIEKAIAIIRKEIGTYKIQSEEGRALRLALADLYYIKRLQSNAVIEYRNYIRMYGPPLDNDRKVMVQAKTRDDQLRSVYEAGIRIANAWDLQGNKTKMVEAFKWVIENQYYDNNHLAEAWYHVASQMIKGKGNKTKEKKRLMAETLWKEVCNKSMDFDTKKFQTQWVFLRRPKTPPLHIDPTQWIKLSMMKSGKAFTELNEHAIAGEIFLEYVKQFDKLKGQKAREGFKKDKYVNMARYAGGLAFSKIEEYEKMAEIFRPYLKGYRDDKFRGPGLMLLGHYGMKGELYTDSMEAYLTLLDEYGTNKVNKLGKPIAVHRSKHLMGKKSNWNGIKMAIPKNYDVGEIRYSLGFMYWKKEDWSGVVMALTPFYKNITFKKNKSREQAMYMLGQSLINLKKYNEAIDVLTAFIFQYPKFKAIEEVYKDTLMACYKAKQWNKVFSKHKDFSLKFKESAWRTYMDYYKAHAEMATGKKVKARNRFLDIAQAETFEDVKADANYYVADGYLRSKPVNYKKAFPHLEASVTLYPRQASLFDAGRTAIQLKKWGLAKTYLDRCIREYPNNDASMMRKARNLLQVVLQEEAK